VLLGHVRKTLSLSAHNPCDMPNHNEPAIPTETSSPTERLDLIEAAAVAALGVTLLAIVALHLLLALLAGLSAFALHRALERQLKKRMPESAAKHTALALLALLLVLLIALALDRLTELTLAASPDSLAALLQLMADSLDKLKTTLPPWLADHVPASPEALNSVAAKWLRENAAEVQMWGNHALRGLIYLLAGLAIGLLAGYSGRHEPAGRAAFMRAWRDRLVQLESAFVDIVAAQLRIALINTAFTAIYLLGIVPALGFHLPFSGTLVAITFVAGLIPVLGNLVSNTAIVLTSLVVSPWLAMLSLAFLVGIHKLEYFLNAHIVGTRIRVPTYELLAAMLVLEAAFGLAGVVAAPIYYAWLTRELRIHGAI